MAQKEMVLLCLFPRQDSASLPVNGTLNKRSYTHTHTHIHTHVRETLYYCFLLVRSDRGGGGTGVLPSPTREVNKERIRTQ